MGAGLIVAQGFDGVFMGGNDRRVEAKNDADARGNRKREHDGPDGDMGGIAAAGEPVDEQGQSDTAGDPREPSRDRKAGGFDEELGDDVLRLPPKGAADADFAGGGSVTVAREIFMMPMPPTRRERKAMPTMMKLKSRCCSLAWRSSSRGTRTWTSRWSAWRTSSMPLESGGGGLDRVGGVDAHVDVGKLEGLAFAGSAGKFDDNVAEHGIVGGQREIDVEVEIAAGQGGAGAASEADGVHDAYDFENFREGERGCRRIV